MYISDTCVWINNSNNFPTTYIIINGVYIVQHDERSNTHVVDYNNFNNNTRIRRCDIIPTVVVIFVVVTFVQTENGLVSSCFCMGIDNV